MYGRPMSICCLCEKERCDGDEAHVSAEGEDERESSGAVRDGGREVEQHGEAAVQRVAPLRSGIVMRKSAVTGMKPTFLPRAKTSASLFGKNSKYGS